MQSYKIYINDRNYNNWSICEMNNFQNVTLDINPIESKLFSNDVFIFQENENENENENEKHNDIKIIHSTIRSTNTIPGVLMLDNNKTYGRQKTTHGDKKGRLLYKCIPDDMRLPPFLIPYELKHVGFSKKMVNLYVTFQFSSWEEKHPCGMLSQVIGPVDILDNFYEYQLYCKSLNTSIQKFQKDAKNALENSAKYEKMYINVNTKECNKNKTHNDFIENIKLKYPCIEDRTNQQLWHIFTIDPPKSTDYDDGYSVRYIDNGICILSIYISNVTILMDALNLWESFSRRIATIYLPDRKRPMLPTILSDCLCSLIEKQTRIAIVMDISIQNDVIVDIKYSNCMIKVIKNYKYEEHDLLNDQKYNELFNITKSISKKYKYLSNVKTSHDVVGYLMILMNYHCAKNMLLFKNGVFRSTIMKREIDVPSSVPDDVSKHIKLWNSACGQYINGIEIDDNSFRHELLDMDAYIHITSPIRRLVDLMNIIKFQQNLNIINLSENAHIFYDKWINDIDYINVTMRSIRKVQCDCSLLDMCHKKPDILENIYEGYMYDKIMRNDGLYQYIVYLPSIKMSSRITLRESIDNYDKRHFKLFLFNDEETFKKKIRLQLLES